MNKKTTYLVFGIAIVLTVSTGAIAYWDPAATPTEQQATAAPVEAPTVPQAEAIADASAPAPQIIEITAQHGYSPLISTAQANRPAIIRVTTNGSFDCSSALVIPSLNYHTRLPMTGSTDIEVPAQVAGTKLTGTCAMGMYSFEVDFTG